MKLWIDDVRPAPEGYEWCKSVNEAKRKIIGLERQIEFIEKKANEAFKDFTPQELELFTALLERMQENLKNIAPLNFEGEQNAKTNQKETKE